MGNGQCNDNLAICNFAIADCPSLDADCRWIADCRLPIRSSDCQLLDCPSEKICHYPLPIGIVDCRCVCHCRLPIADCRLTSVGLHVTLRHRRRAKVLLDDQRDGAAQSRLRRWDRWARSGWTAPGRLRRCTSFITNGPTRSHAAVTSPTITITFGRQARRQRGQADAEVAAHARERLDGAGVALVGHAGAMSSKRTGAGRAAVGVSARLREVPDRGGVGRVALPAAAVAARAERPVFVDADVAELAAHGVGAVHQLSVQQQANADAFRDRDRDEVASHVPGDGRTRARPAHRHSRRCRAPLAGRLPLRAPLQSTSRHPRFGAKIAGPTRRRGPAG